MRSNWLLLLAPAALMAAGLETLQAPGGGALRIDRRSSDRVRVASEYWRLEFDLRNGGVLDTVVFPNGSGKNLLVEPFRTYVDGWSDAGSPEVRTGGSQQGNVVQLVFSGSMGAAGRTPGPATFETTWTLSPFIVRADHKLRFSADVEASRVGVGCATLRSDLNEFGFRPGNPADDTDKRKRVLTIFGNGNAAGARWIEEHSAPLYLLFFHRDLEGFDLTTASDLATWETGLTGRGGRGLYRAAVAAGGVRVEREPLHMAYPVRIAKGEYTFSYYLGLPRIVEQSDRRWRHLSFGNHPWPSDAEIGRWAEAGVNIVRLHNDYAPDEDFWHDGAWPPYDERGMAEMRRVIAACHRHNIKVVPYFSIQEFHPKAQGYAEHVAEWKRTIDAFGTEIHNPVGKGEFGVQTCPQSGWLDRRKQDIEKAYRELGFDGIYYDWVRTLPCNNRNHDARLHLGTDGIVDLLAWTRRLIAPQGVLILHLNGNTPSITLENFADLVVNMEELSNDPRVVKFRDVPVVTVLAESIPRSPCPSYLPDRTLERNRNNIAQLVLAGMFPWSGGAGGPVYEETLRLFRTFRPYPLERYRFHSGYAGVVRTSWDDVYGAVYASSERALVVISNTSGERRRNVVWRVRPEALGMAPAARVQVKDTSSGQNRAIEWNGLEDGALVTDLEGYEYRLFEISRQ